MKGFIMFTHDFNDFLPGNADTSEEAEIWKTDWMAGQCPLRDYAISFPASPDMGTLFPYVGKQAALYRCPNQPAGELNSGMGSNGKYDYTSIEMFPGAKMEKIELQSRFKYPDGSSQSVPTPFLVEEDPAAYMNNGYLEATHGNGDKMSHVHRNGSSYGALDGSVHFFNEPEETNALSWELLTPSGQWVPNNDGSSPGGYNIPWGYWNNL
jgi:hypothetical protein